MPPAKHHINLTLTPRTDGSRNYDLSQNPNDDRQILGANNQITIPDNHWYFLHFTLDGANLAFDGQEAEDIFIIKRGTSCPDRNDGENLKSFPKKRIEHNPTTKTLTVKNNNIFSGNHSYRLCITERGQERDFDPVIINGGGGQQEPFTWSNLLVGLGFLGGAAVVGLAYFTGFLERIFG